ncbi:MAG: RNA polymerase sigma factor [Cytophagaceae bacterium]
MTLVNEEILEGCRKNDPLYQRQLYQIFSSRVLLTCLRYTSCRADAEDLLQESFIKIFNNISNYEGKGSFEGWIRKIVINTCLKELEKKNYHYSLSHPDAERLPVYTRENIIEKISAEEISDTIDQLPEGYRHVFKLFAVEGYTHKEIGQMMNISAGTSKSQFFNAKRILQNLILTIAGEDEIDYKVQIA